jgi:DNA-binding response OmpR family regulator
MKKKTKILWIQGNRAEGLSFIPKIRNKEFVVEIVKTGSEACRLLPLLHPDLVILNASSMRTTGIRVCKSLRKKSKNTPIIVITDPSLITSDKLNANEVLVLPFTVRKLLNRIMPLIPMESNNTVEVGNIRLDMDRKHVVCDERKAILTPRLVDLLLFFMRNPGNVLEREALFQEVWETEYTVDTRTLDVHISWLRQAIEEEPRKPKYLKTIRGVGYRLDV